MSRNSIVGLCLLTVDCRLHFFQGWGWVSQGPFHSKQMPLVQRQPPPFRSVWRRSPIRSGLFPSPFLHFLCLKQGGKVWEQKLAYAWTVPLLPPVLPVFPFLGREPAARNGLGSKRVSELCPCPALLFHLPSVHQSGMKPNNLGSPLARKPGPSPSGWPFGPR